MEIFIKKDLTGAPLKHVHHLKKKKISPELTEYEGPPGSNVTSLLNLFMRPQKGWFINLLRLKKERDLSLGRGDLGWILSY